MKAVTRSRYGGPEVLDIVEVETPTPDADEVLLDVEAMSLNAGDWHLLRGSPLFIRLLYGGLLRPEISILGMDVAGTVEAVGTDVTAWQSGERVVGTLSEHGNGGFAEFVCAPETELVAIPDGVSVEAAAAVPTAGLSALQGLRDDGQLAAGEDVLVHGASGGVGTFAVQLGTRLGADVTGVCSTDKLDLVRSLGAEQVLDYHETDITATGWRFDLVLDAAAAHSLRGYRRILRPGGRYVMVGGPAGTFLKTMAIGPLVSRLGDRQFGSFEIEPAVDDLATLVSSLADGSIRSVIDRTFPLAETADALRYLEAGRARGKVVVTMDDGTG